MTTPRKIIFISGAVILFVIVLLAILESPRRPAAHVSFSYLGVSTSSNGSLITIGITNHSTSSVDYIVGPPQLQSNGVWSAAPLVLGTRMTSVGAGRSGTVTVTMPLISGESRVPILWGFSYSAGATRWQEIREDAIEGLRMHNFRGRGALYTNYVTGITL